MDVEACYRGLVDKGIALTGDSAGGNLALVLLSIASAQAAKGGIAPVGAVVLSPVTDLALTSESFDRRAEADHTSPNPRQPGSFLSGRNRSDESAGLASLR
jgi:epsilon-lactone hydrolase